MKHHWLAAAAALLVVPAVTLGSGLTAEASPSHHADDNHGPGPAKGNNGAPTATPVKHLVVIYDENVSFDHYFGTYPKAANTDGSKFTAAPGTPGINGLNDALLTANPNGVNPQRLTPKQAVTCDQNHNYTAEQQAFDGGLMDKFVEFTNSGDCTTPKENAPTYTGEFYEPGLVMDYYDGNTVTALWNYAQNYAMSDNSYNTTFGPSTPGALNLVSGQTHGFAPEGTAVTANTTVIGDPQPTGDKCDTRDNTTSTDPNNKNIGDLLNAKQVSWGWFQGGFADCAATHTNGAGVPSADYIPHHEPFQYYASTANPQHTPPATVDEIGHDGAANHQYDLTDFWTAVDHGNMPAVSFLKAPAYQDGHAGYSDPLDEQHFLVDTINKLQKSSDWKDTAVVIAYDDSDGWYDHQMSPIINQSQDAATDKLHDDTDCGTNGEAVLGGYQDRCGYGPRLPLLVVSPFAKKNYVDHTITDQTSILKFVEDNWTTGRVGNASFDERAGSLTGMFDFSSRANSGQLMLDPKTGQPTGRR